MNLPAYRPWMNAVLYQSVWFTSVLGRERFVVLALALLALHLFLCRDRRVELAVMLAVGVLGVAVDSGLTLGGVFVFDPPDSVLPLPFWLVLIWLGFAATLRHALRFLIERRALAVVLAAIGGPLSYLGAARLGAVSLPLDTWPTAALLALVWALEMLALVTLVRMIERRAAPASTG